MDNVQKVKKIEVISRTPLETLIHVLTHSVCRYIYIYFTLYVIIFFNETQNVMSWYFYNEFDFGKVGIL